MLCVIFLSLLTAIITIFAIIAGYLTDSLPEGSTNRADELFISSPRAFLLKSTKLSTSDPSKRRRALERFILALSDQQLVTGLSVLLAGYIKHCDISVYSFQITTALAWFSCTTHLATLTVLRQYFNNNG